jgi:hypothetical protein
VGFSYEACPFKVFFGDEGASGGKRVDQQLGKITSKIEINDLLFSNAVLAPLTDRMLVRLYDGGMTAARAPHAFIASESGAWRYRQAQTGAGVRRRRPGIR